MAADRVIIAEYVETITGGTHQIAGFEHLTITPQSHVFFFDGDEKDPARFTVLPFHAFDLLECDIVSRAQYDADCKSKGLPE